MSKATEAVMPGEMAGVFKAGAARVDITPPPGTLINGDFIAHYASEIHDPLYAKAIVCNGQGAIAALVIVDICAMKREFIKTVKKKITDATGILPENILLAATHTHAGGAVEDLLLGACDLAYRLYLPERILLAVQLAQQRLRPAKIAFGSAEAPEHVVCRRYFMKAGYRSKNPVTGQDDAIKTNPIGDEHQIDRPVADTDPGIAYLAIKGLDDEWIALLGNYSMHYVGDFAPGTITADYFGVFSEQVGIRLNAGDQFVGILSNGTSGDTNIWDFLHPNRYPEALHEKSRLIGTSLAEKVVHSLDNAEWDLRPSLATQYAEITVGIRKPSADELYASRKLVKESAYEKIAGNADDLKQIYAREQVLLNEYPDAAPFPVQVFKIGKGMIGALGGEFFSETGLWLKQQVGGHYFTITICNDYVGYVPPMHAFELGGYETWRCRTSFLDTEAESLIRNALASLIKKLISA